MFERATLFHLKFEGAHPFVNCNGKLGILVLNLMQAGFRRLTSNTLIAGAIVNPSIPTTVTTAPVE